VNAPDMGPSGGTTGTTEPTQISASGGTSGVMTPSTTLTEGLNLPCTGGYSDAENCISSCTTDSTTSAALVCLDGRWQCPSNSVPQSSCSANACGTTARTCCNPVTGLITRTSCENGLRQACPANTIERGNGHDTSCIPEGLPNLDCLELEGGTCDPPHIQCYSNYTTCDCVDAKWTCSTLLI
jgi:hypothetical protein